MTKDSKFYFCDKHRFWGFICKHW